MGEWGRWNGSRLRPTRAERSSCERGTIEMSVGTDFLLLPPLGPSILEPYLKIPKFRLYFLLKEIPLCYSLTPYLQARFARSVAGVISEWRQM